MGERENETMGGLYRKKQAKWPAQCVTNHELIAKDEEKFFFFFFLAREMF